MSTWEYRHTVLRQDEVAAFIHDTKGGKYSALLPLLGLYKMEVAAENLRQLAKVVEQKSNLRETKALLKGVETRRKEIFGTDNDDQILQWVEDLHSKYCGASTTANESLSLCTELGIALDM